MMMEWTECLVSPLGLILTESILAEPFSVASTNTPLLKRDMIRHSKRGLITIIIARRQTNEPGHRVHILNPS